MVCIIIQGEGNKVLRLGIYLFAVMNWASAIDYTLSPLTDSGYAGTFQGVMHLYVVTGVTLVFMFIGPIGTSIVPKAYFGIAERFSVYSVTVFNAILGLYGFVFIDRIEKNLNIEGRVR